MLRCVKNITHHRIRRYLPVCIQKLSFYSSDNKSDTENTQTQPDLKIELPDPPEYPTSCCGNQCVNCVWNDYFRELEEYNEKVKAITEKNKEIEEKMKKQQHVDPIYDEFMKLEQRLKEGKK